ncbi:MAG TPA: hypothetical protein VK745_16765 [Polyangiaceae bacterium]|nr:hypothetical protein [Polyangiaceae bacterium]
MPALLTPPVADWPPELELAPELPGFPPEEAPPAPEPAPTLPPASSCPALDVLEPPNVLEPPSVLEPPNVLEPPSVLEPATALAVPPALGAPLEFEPARPVAALAPTRPSLDPDELQPAWVARTRVAPNDASKDILRIIAGFLIFGRARRGGDLEMATTRHNHWAEC